MRQIETALHDATTSYGRIRYHRPPHDEPDFAWVNLDDIMRMLKMPMGLRIEMLRAIQEDWKEDLKTIATSEGIVTICPHYMIQGLFDAWIQEGFAGNDILKTYLAEGMRASKKLTEGWSTEDRRAFMFAALTRSAN